MYQVQDSSALVAGHRALLRPRAHGLRVPRTVVLLGLHQPAHRHLVGDGRGGAAALPGLRGRLHAARSFGVIDGLYRGRGGDRARSRAASRPTAAGATRRSRRSATGSRRSASSGSSPAGSAVGAIGALVMVDRIGKGIRTAPRDALISLSSSPKYARRRRSACTARWTRPARCSVRCWRSACSPLAPLAFDLGVPRLVLLRARRARRDRAASCREHRERAARRSRRSSLRARRAAAAASAASALLVLAACAARPGDDQRRLPLPRPAAPRSTSARAASRCCSSGSALAYMLLAVPVGRLADRVGRGRVFLGGYALLLAVYASLLVPAIGRRRAGRRARARSARYYAATDGVLVALAASDARRGAARQRPRRPRHRHEPGPPRRLGRLRRAVDAGRARHRRARLRRRPGRRDAWSPRCCCAARARSRPLRSRGARVRPARHGLRGSWPSAPSSARSWRSARPAAAPRALGRPLARALRGVPRARRADAGRPHFGELTSTSAADPGRVRRATGRLCERVHVAARARHLPRAQPLARREPTRRGSSGPTGACATRSRLERHPEPRARLARRPLRRDDDVRHRPLVRRRPARSRRRRR